MAILVALQQVDLSAIVNRPTSYVVTITNQSASAVNLASVDILELGSRAATIEQPQFLVPQMPVGLGLPTILAGASVSYGFKAVWRAPIGSGPTPQTALLGLGGGVPGMMTGQPVLPNYYMQASALVSDGSTNLAIITVPVLSAVPIFPRPEGGATVFTQGNNANLIAAIL